MQASACSCGQCLRPVGAPSTWSCSNCQSFVRWRHRHVAISNVFFLLFFAQDAENSRTPSFVCVMLQLPWVFTFSLLCAMLQLPCINFQGFLPVLTQKTQMFILQAQSAEQFEVLCVLLLNILLPRRLKQLKQTPFPTFEQVFAIPPFALCHGFCHPPQPRHPHLCLHVRRCCVMSFRWMQFLFLISSIFPKSSS